MGCLRLQTSLQPTDRNDRRQWGGGHSGNRHRCSLQTTVTEDPSGTLACYQFTVLTIKPKLVGHVKLIELNVVAMSSAVCAGRGAL